MKKNISILLVIIVTYSADLKGQITFHKKITTHLDYINPILLTADSGFIFTTQGNNLLKFDSTGNLTWGKQFLGSQFTFSHPNLIQTYDGGYLIISDVFNQLGFCLIKLNASCDTTWTKFYQFSIYAGVISACQAADGGFAIITSVHNGNLFETCIVRTDSTGDSLWVKTYHYSNQYTYGYDIQQTYDGGFILLNECNAGFFLTKTNSAGDVLWTKSAGITRGNLIQTSDSGFVLFGQNNNYLLKTDSSGNIIWTIGLMDNNWGGVGEVNFVEEESNGKLMVAGTTPEYNLPFGPMHAFIAQINSTGTIEWSALFITGDSSAYSIRKTYDGGYIVGGAEHWTTGEHFLAKTDSIGNIGCNTFLSPINVDTPQIISSSMNTFVSSIPIAVSSFPLDVYPTSVIISTQCESVGIVRPEVENQISISPIPTSTEFSIESENSAFKFVNIFDPLGRLIYTASGINSRQWTVDCRQFNPGIYFINVHFADEMVQRKLIIE